MSPGVRSTRRAPCGTKGAGETAQCRVARRGRTAATVCGRRGAPTRLEERHVQAPWLVGVVRLDDSPDRSGVPRVLGLGRDHRSGCAEPATRPVRRSQSAADGGRAAAAFLPAAHPGCSTRALSGQHVPEPRPQSTDQRPGRSGLDLRAGRRHRLLERCAPGPHGRQPARPGQRARGGVRQRVPRWLRAAPRRDVRDPRRRRADSLHGRELGPGSDRPPEPRRTGRAAGPRFADVRHRHVGLDVYRRPPGDRQGRLRHPARRVARGRHGGGGPVRF